LIFGSEPSHLNKCDYLNSSGDLPCACLITITPYIAKSKMGLYQLATSRNWGTLLQWLEQIVHNDYL